VAEFSRQTIAVLVALCQHPQDWSHGYDLAKRTGLKSGTLYPILIRLAERDIIEASWEADPPSGRPRRHLYRLTAAGLAQAQAVQKSLASHTSSAAQSSPTGTRSPQARPGLSLRGTA
jgi:PadR family transcriptional regulator